MEPKPPGAGLICSETESAPRPRTSGAGATQKCGGSATLFAGFKVYYDTHEC